MSFLIKCVIRRYSYKSLKFGKYNTKDFKLFLDNSNNKIVSPFHDIPLRHDGDNIFNMIVEIPKFTNSKMEISKSHKLNPIVFDTKNGSIRQIRNVFPFHGYLWNYGALPQTWENPFTGNTFTDNLGDNDPIDACEIGGRIIDTGTVIRVKLLGILGMIDQGEMDWKLIVINTSDPLCDKLNDITDVEKLMPGLLDATRRWFKFYKVPDGKSETNFAFDGKFQNKEFSLEIIKETHESWKSLISGVIKTDINCENTTISDSPYFINEESMKNIIQLENCFQDCQKEEKDGEWFFVT